MVRKQSSGLTNVYIPVYAAYLPCQQKCLLKHLKFLLYKSFLI